MQKPLSEPVTAFIVSPGSVPEGLEFNVAFLVGMHVAFLVGMHVAWWLRMKF